MGDGWGGWSRVALGCSFAIERHKHRVPASTANELVLPTRFFDLYSLAVKIYLEDLQAEEQAANRRAENSAEPSPKRARIRMLRRGASDERPLLTVFAIVCTSGNCENLANNLVRNLARRAKVRAKFLAKSSQLPELQNMAKTVRKGFL